VIVACSSSVFHADADVARRPGGRSRCLAGADIAGLGLIACIFTDTKNFMFTQKPKLTYPS
jgi:hypothetical protein